MKSILLYFAVLLFSLSLPAQNDCQGFFTTRSGAQLEYQIANAKGKLQATHTHTIKSLKNTAQGLEVSIALTGKDEKGKETFSSTSTVTCTLDRLLIDVNSLVGPQQNAFRDAEVLVTGDGFYLPHQPQVGQELPNSTNEIQFKNNTMTLMTMKINIQNFKVAGQEKISTPAGSFDCYRMTYDLDTKAMIINTTSKIVQWYAKNVGMVKQEVYNKNGSLVSTSTLTKFNS